MFVPGDISMGNENSRRAGVKSQATLHVNITTQYDEMHQRDVQERQAEERRKQNALPAWHEQSTIGESALGKLNKEEESAGVKVENHGDQLDEENHEMDEEGEEYAGEEEYEQSSRPALTEEQIKEREAERTLAEYYAQLAKKNAEDDEDMDDEDMDEDDFEDVQDGLDEDHGNDISDGNASNREVTAKSDTIDAKIEAAKEEDEDEDEDMADLEDIELETVKKDDVKQQNNTGDDEEEEGGDGDDDDFEDCLLYTSRCV